MRTPVAHYLCLGLESLLGNSQVNVKLELLVLPCLSPSLYFSSVRVC